MLDLQAGVSLFRSISDEDEVKSRLKGGGGGYKVA